MDLSVGNAVKKYKKQKNMTLQELAAKTGLSASYLSLLERGQNSPSIKNLNTICKSLDVTLSDLIIAAEKSEDVIVRANQRKILADTPEYLYEVTFDSDHNISAIIMTIRNNEPHSVSTHVADEIGYIISGSMVMTINDTEYEVSSGDCIYIPANIPHFYQKNSKEDCISIWVYASSKVIENIKNL